MDGTRIYSFTHFKGIMWYTNVKVTLTVMSLRPHDECILHYFHLVKLSEKSIVESADDATRVKLVFKEYRNNNMIRDSG